MGNRQRWAKVTTLGALTIILEALCQLEKEVGRVNWWINCEKRLIFYSACFNLNFKIFIF